MAVDLEDFPTCAELTQTQAWAGGAPVPISPLPAAAAGDSGSRYTEQAVLGVGGMGKIVLAHDARIGRDVAVKQLRPARDLTPEERTRFLREAQVQGQLEHPSIVPVYDIDHRPDGTHILHDAARAGAGAPRHHRGPAAGRAGGDGALHAARAPAGVRDGVPRGGLRAQPRRDPPRSEAVEHHAGRPRRGLRPRLGVARLLDQSEEPGPRERLSMPGIGLGTPLYMAPEQLDDPNVDARADVFALGAVLFEILTFKRLRTTAAIAASVDARVSVRAPDRPVALELELLCVRATQHEPVDRFPSARALQEALARYLEGDRELEQRRELAAGHAGRARAARRRAGEPNADVERETGADAGDLRRAAALRADGRPAARAAPGLAAPAPAGGADAREPALSG